MPPDPKTWRGVLVSTPDHDAILVVIDEKLGDLLQLLQGADLELRPRGIDDVETVLVASFVGLPVETLVLVTRLVEDVLDRPDDLLTIGEDLADEVIPLGIELHAVAGGVREDRDEDFSRGRGQLLQRTEIQTGIEERLLHHFQGLDPTVAVDGPLPLLGTEDPAHGVGNADEPLGVATGEAVHRVLVQRIEIVLTLLVARVVAQSDGLAVHQFDAASFDGIADDDVLGSLLGRLIDGDVVEGVHDYSLSIL